MIRPLLHNTKPHQIRKQQQYTFTELVRVADEAVAVKILGQLIDRGLDSVTNEITRTIPIIAHDRDLLKEDPSRAIADRTRRRCLFGAAKFHQCLSSCGKAWICGYPRNDHRESRVGRVSLASRLRTHGGSRYLRCLAVCGSRGTS
ncbi:hypothetical protein LB503_006245 [Fusarium chuoi]|nr:hypothetical protein LB503_006245 [Fusarium chuoi]